MIGSAIWHLEIKGRSGDRNHTYFFVLPYVLNPGMHEEKQVTRMHGGRGANRTPSIFKSIQPIDMK